MTRQGIAAAPQGVLCFAKYGARKTRNCGKPGFLRSKKCPQSKTHSESTLLQTRKHRIEITDEDGKEEIRIESAGGKMRVITGKGVSV